MTGICNLLCLVIIMAAFASASTDYCNLKTCRQWGGLHTMCKYPSSSPSSTCVNWKARGLTQEEKERVVKKHNELRQRVASGKESRGINGPQPPAVYMPNLVWDNELEKIAQKWVDQCIAGHDDCKDVERFQVGQNMAMTRNSADNNTPVEEFVQMWYDEVDKFDRNQVKKLTTVNGVAHYTQIVWADTKSIGCGRIKYSESGWNNQLLICNYGPMGNWIDKKIYEIKK